MTLKNFVRDGFWGRIIYKLSKRQYFNYQEDDATYVIPDKYLIKESQPKPSDASINSSGTIIGDNKIIVTWDNPDDPDNPRNWPFWEKFILVLEICLLSFSVYSTSAIYTPGVEILMEELKISRVKATLPLTMFLIGAGFGPMVFAPISENATQGRTLIYVITLLLFIILQIPISLVNDIASLSTLRFFSGIFASPVLAMGGASVGDVTHPHFLPLTICLWSIASVSGPTSGPFWGSILITKRDWHWTFWLVAMVCGVTWTFLSFFLPETNPDTILLRKAQRIRKLTGNENFITEVEANGQKITLKETLWRPFEIIIFEPIVLFIDLYIGLVYIILYIWLEAFPLVFPVLYNFTVITSGLAFLSVTVGIVIAAIMYNYTMYYLFTKPILTGKVVYPEVFLPVMIVGAICMPIGILIFGWSSTPSAHWIGALIGSALFGSGGFIVVQTGFNYLGASFPKYIASALAGNDLFRCVLAGCAPLYAHALFRNLATDNYPVAWGSTILGGISVAMIAIPVIFYWKGPELRAKSKYSDTSN